jgi:hypothetical protein
MSKKLILACVLSNLSCAPESQKTVAPFRAHVLARNDNGTYGFKTVTFQTLTSLKRMEGTLGRVLGNAALDVQSDVKDDVIKKMDPTQLFSRRGNSIKLNFVVRKGVIYPMDFKSLEILSFYYTYEQVVSFWQNSLGITLLDPKPDLFYNPSITLDEGGTVLEGNIKMNAAYLPITDDFMFFETAKSEDVPVKINHAVISHEYTHYIFHQQFAKMDHRFYDTANSLATEDLDGMNEGVADFFAYVYTGHADEFKRSLPEMSETRRLPAAWQLSTLSSAPCAESFYCKGSILASALYEITTRFGYDKIKVAQNVYRALNEFRTDWASEKENAAFDYHLLINRIIAEADPQERGNYCTVFTKWFDEPKVKDKLSCSDQ